MCLHIKAARQVSCREAGEVVWSLGDKSGSLAYSYQRSKAKH